MKFFAKLLVFIGIACYLFAIYLIWERNNPNIPPLSYQESYENSQSSNHPVRITIKDVGIDLPIYPAKTNNGKLETTNKGASYPVTSPNIIYAHDWVSLFGPLTNVHQGNVIEIEYANKTKKTFIVESTSVVSYKKSDILSQTGDRRITLYTCTGFFDSQRFVVVAHLS